METGIGKINFAEKKEKIIDFFVCVAASAAMRLSSPRKSKT